MRKPRARESASPRTREGSTDVRRRQATARPSSPQRRSRPPRRRRRYRLQPRAKVLLAVLLLLVCVFLGRCVLPFGDGSSSGGPGTSGGDAHSLERKIVSDSAIVMDADKNKVVYEKAADEPRSPASLVKMMTVYTAIQNNRDVNQLVTVPPGAFEGLYQEQASTAGLVSGEALPMKDLFFAAILPSGADAAKTLAILTSGSESAFVKRMNETAEQMGMKNTHFKNVTGLNDPEQKTTCRDMAVFLNKALSNKLFYEVMTSMNYTTSPTAHHPQGLSFTHTLQKHMEDFGEVVGDKTYKLIGGKTGYTPEAGVCLASIGQSANGSLAVAVTLHAPTDSENYYPIIKDAATLYDLVFEKKRS